MNDIIIGLFAFTMALNVIALVRHWRMLRMLNIVLNNLIMTQQMFCELTAAQEKPEPERGAAIEAVIAKFQH